MTAKIGIIGGGLMGREIASAFARWCALQDATTTPELIAVADLSEDVLSWFDRIGSVTQKTTDYAELLANPDVDVVYVAVPHHLHEKIYCDVLDAGKDLLAEKPFGIDLAAAEKIVAKIAETGRFVRCSSEFPFLPGAQRAVALCREDSFGRVLEVNAGFLHASDLDPSKAANWKRKSATCGEIGVMADLGMHVVHLPLRLGWSPSSVYAQLQKGYPERQGEPCDTWDNATLNTWTRITDHDVPMNLQMKRLAPGETNTWFFEVLGTDGGVRFSTKEPKTLWTFHRGSDQLWQKTDLGFGMAFPTITGGIFEPGFPDIIMQMWAAFLAERSGELGDRFGCATPEEALASHRLFDAARCSHADKSAVPLP